MTMRVGRKYRCQNLDCRSEVVVVEASMESGRNPRCCCGDEMKKPYYKPTFKMQSFGRLEIDDLVETRD
jgi:hypothetical protein